NSIKKANECLWNASNGGSFKQVATDKAGEVLSFVREKNGNKVLVLINVTSQDINIQMTDEKLAGTYTNLMTDESLEIVAGQAVALPAWGYLVLK
ncbi:MAG TPA: alpha-glucosidase C-terminal domain-containing protein, partial [Bacteroidales bacterium]|nr:alpha-glucosidase C-terminal domain-containing protein [Bacteroidales bacterium]